MGKIWKRLFLLICVAGLVGLSLDVSARSLEDKGLCPQGIKKAKELFVDYNPYDIKGVCFTLPTSKLYHLVDRTKALYTIWNTSLTYLDFDKKSVPQYFGKAIVIGLGAQRYKTASGSINIVPKLKVIDFYQ